MKFKLHSRRPSFIVGHHTIYVFAYFTSITVAHIVVVILVARGPSDPFRIWLLPLHHSLPFRLPYRVPATPCLLHTYTVLLQHDQPARFHPPE